MEGAVKSKAFDRLSEVASTLVNPEMRRWEDESGCIIGCFCSAMPVEISIAAGLLSFRMRATDSARTELSDSHFSSINCSFPRHAFNHGSGLGDTATPEEAL